MSKIDLIQDTWVDLVFEGKNHAYGAYQLRKETGKRNFYALLTMFIIAVIIGAVVFVKGVVENAMKTDVGIEADIELAQLAETLSWLSWLKRRKLRLRRKKNRRLRKLK